MFSLSPQPITERTNIRILAIVISAVLLGTSLFTSSARCAELVLAWKDNNDSSRAGYKFYYGTSSRKYTTVLDLGKKTSYTLSNLLNGKTYYFAVTAYTANKTESKYSNEVEYTVPAERSLNSITISGPLQIKANSSSKLVCKAHYNDGSTETPAGGIIWSTDSPSVSIDSNSSIKVGDVGTHTPVIIKAAYKGKSDTHTIAVAKETASLSTLSISGPRLIEETSGVQYTCTAQFSDNRTSDISDAVSWTVNSPSAEIDPNGLLTTHAILNEEKLTIRAEYNGKHVDYTVTINHTKSTYTLTVETLGNGSVQLFPPGGIYNKGTVVTLTAEAEYAWTFDGWQGNVMNPDNHVTSVTMDSDINLCAIFLEDTDLDSVPDSEEWGSNSNDPDFDGNADSIADYLQGNVASIHTYNHDHFLTLISPEPVTFTTCKVLDPASIDDSPEDVDFPLGLTQSTIENIEPGGATTLTIRLPAGTVYDKFYKYGATLSNPSPHWYEFMYDEESQTGAIFEGDTATLYFQDSRRGDDDLSENGIISGLSGPVIYRQPEASENSSHALNDGEGANQLSGGGSSACFITSISTPP